MKNCCQQRITVTLFRNDAQSKAAHAGKQPFMIFVTPFGHIRHCLMLCKDFSVVFNNDSCCYGVMSFVVMCMISIKKYRGFQLSSKRFRKVANLLFGPS
jgi:hypothetical protein